MLHRCNRLDDHNILRYIYTLFIMSYDYLYNNMQYCGHLIDRFDLCRLRQKIKYFDTFEFIKDNCKMITVLVNKG